MKNFIKVQKSKKYKKMSLLKIIFLKFYNNFIKNLFSRDNIKSNYF